VSHGELSRRAEGEVRWESRISRQVEAVEEHFYYSWTRRRRGGVNAE